MRFIKAKLSEVKKGGIFTFMPMKEARSFVKGRRTSKGNKTWCEGIKDTIAVRPDKTVYVKSLDELKYSINPLNIEIIYV